MCVIEFAEGFKTDRAKSLSTLKARKKRLLLSREKPKHRLPRPSLDGPCCRRCKKAVGGRVIVGQDGSHWCHKCFRCFVCHVSITGSYCQNAKNRLFCESCSQKTEQRISTPRESSPEEAGSQQCCPSIKLSSIPTTTPSSTKPMLTPLPSSPSSDTPVEKKHQTKHRQRSAYERSCVISPTRHSFEVNNFVDHIVLS